MRYIKKIICVLISMVLCFSMAGCVQTYSGAENYHMIFDNVHEANKTFTKEGQKETLLGFGEYMYCSYMLLFPKEAPDDILEFEYYWSQVIDYDDYGIYFTYSLDDDKYDAFKTKLRDFSVTYKEQVNKPVYLEDTFEYPAYVLSWSEDVDSRGFCEYIMLDDENCRVINVYQLFYGLEELQSKADVNILPKEKTCNEVYGLMPSTISFAKNTGYCVYAFLDDDNNMFVPDVESLVYDNSFLESL